MSRITGVYELLSPLSHIGESAGVDSYLNTQNMVVNGQVEEVFVYSGNAIRGQLRDCGAEYFLGGTPIDNGLFYLLFSGGSISGDQKNDIGRFREIREQIPLVSIFGGGIGTAILSGKLKVSDGYLISSECNNFLPKKFHSSLSWKQQTGERSFTRFDDSKNFDKQKLMEEMPIAKKEKKQGEASTQMRYTIETINAGARIYSMIDLMNLNGIEIGCLVSCIVKMSAFPYLGGKSNIGMGRYKLNYKYGNAEFVNVDENGIIDLSQFAHESLEAYNEHLSTINIASLTL